MRPRLRLKAEKWRRGESNPRPRPRKEKRLRACPAFSISSSLSQAGRVREDQRQLEVTGRLMRALRSSPLADTRYPAHGPRLDGCLGLFRRGRTRESPHLWFCPVFYEASGPPRLATSPTKSATSKPGVPNGCRCIFSFDLPDQCTRAAQSARRSKTFPKLFTRAYETFWESACSKVHH